MSENNKPTRYKIEYADVRLTPEQLKAVEDKIELLESQVIEDDLIKKRFVTFLRKLSMVININEFDLNSILKNDKDYDILISQGVTDTIRMHFKFNQ